MDFRSNARNFLKTQVQFSQDFILKFSHSDIFCRLSNIKLGEVARKNRFTVEKIKPSDGATFTPKGLLSHPRGYFHI